MRLVVAQPTFDLTFCAWIVAEEARTPALDAQYAERIPLILYPQSLLYFRFPYQVLS